MPSTVILLHFKKSSIQQLQLLFRVLQLAVSYAFHNGDMQIDFFDYNQATT